MSKHVIHKLVRIGIVEHSSQVPDRHRLAVGLLCSQVRLVEGLEVLVAVAKHLQVFGIELDVERLSAALRTVAEHAPRSVGMRALHPRLFFLEELSRPPASLGSKLFENPLFRRPNMASRSRIARGLLRLGILDHRGQRLFVGLPLYG